MPGSTPFRHTLALVAVVIVRGLAWPIAAGASPILGQVDTFEDGTVAGWQVGDISHSAPPANIDGGGPAGVDDHYMRLTAFGGGNRPGSRLTAFNEMQWAGDYLAAGITSISMDVRNFGPDDVTLRLLLLTLVAGSFPNAAVTFDGILLPAAGNWTSVSFSLLPSDLNVLEGTAEGALSQATSLRIFHNPDPTFSVAPSSSSPPVTALVGVDNIRARAATVPEPATLSLLALALAISWPAIRRRAR